MKLKLSAVLGSLLFVVLPGISQNTDDYEASIREFQEELDASYKDRDESPLENRDRRRFQGLEYFPIDQKYSVTAQVIYTPDSEPFNMPTTIPRENIHWKYADLVFELDGQEYTLEVYQSQNLLNDEEYADYLFLPFLDLTNGEGSYGGGRYLDLRIPDGNTIEIDFNKAYNPYCAYNSRYSCPLVPRVNRLMTRIEAGVMDWEKH
jgi:uncharacterized protein (DUF1684 family)